MSNDNAQKGQPNHGFQGANLIPMLSVLSNLSLKLKLIWLELGEEKGGAVLHLPSYDRVGSWWEGLGAE